MHAPIFIHSMHRCGSTWLFKAFRRQSQLYWCYGEPEHEVVAQLINSDELETIGQQMANRLRHGKLDLPYFWEIIQFREQLANTVNEAIAYKNYFPGQLLDRTDHEFFSRLISLSPHTPVLQLCRSIGRAHALKNAFGGTHIHLWRAPRSQWWSMKIDQYFDDAIQLIYNAPNLPIELCWVKERVSFSQVSLDRVTPDVERVRAEPLTQQDAYLAYYSFWLYANLSLRQIADIDFCIDRVSYDLDYRSHVINQFDATGIKSLHFNDCQVPAVVLHSSEINWYQVIEQEVHQNMLHHWKPEEVNLLLQNLDLIRALHASSEASIDDARRQRELVRRTIEAFQYTYRQLYFLKNAG